MEESKTIHFKCHVKAIYFHEILFVIEMIHLKNVVEVVVLHGACDYSIYCFLLK